MTQWFHARDGRQGGPVSEEEIQRLVGSGALGPDDLVWRDGMPEWVPLRSLPELSPRSGLVSPQAPAAVNPHQSPMASMAAQAAFATRGGADIDVAEAMALGWRGFVQNVLIGCLGTLLYVAISVVLGLIPVLSLFAPIFVTYPLAAGLLHAGVIACDNARGNPRQVVMDDFFIAFRTNYWQAVLFSFLLMAGLFGAAFAIGLPLVLLIPMVEESPAPLVGFALLALVPLVYLSLRLVFGFQFLTDKGLGATESLGATWRATRGQVLSLFLLSLLLIAVNFAGMLMLLVGIIPAAFLIACIFGAAFRQVAGD